MLKLFLLGIHSNPSSHYQLTFFIKKEFYKAHESNQFLEAFLQNDIPLLRMQLYLVSVLEL
jgi:hypothetical protein